MDNDILSAVSEDDAGLPVLVFPETAEVLAITHILELPRYLGIRDGQAVVIYEDRDDVFLGWPDEVKAHLALAPLPPTPGWSPVLRLVFRQITVRTRLPLEAADRAFADMVEPLTPRKLWKDRQRQLKKASRRGFWQPTTVVAATRFFPAKSWPRTNQEQTDVLRRELVACFDLLNNVILGVGLFSGDPRLLPVAQGDLAGLCPVIVESAPMISGRRCGASFLYEIHSDFPTVLEHPLSEEESGQLMEVARSAYYGEQPLFLVYELWNSAVAARISRRYAVAATALGTVLEVLFSTVVREVSAIFGEPSGRSESVLSAGLKNVVADHLGRYANTAVDLNDLNNPFGSWWGGGYKLRNSVVHEAYKPTGAEIEAAFNQAGDVVRAMRDGLCSKNVTRPLGDLLAVLTESPSEVHLSG